MSGIGKGHVTSSVGKMLQFRGFSVIPIKIDPYLNTDPGLMNPSEHGEVFVTEDVWQFETMGSDHVLKIAELDQDFGSYERFLDQNMHPSPNISSGQVFTTILKKERNGDFLGKTVQMHCTRVDRNAATVTAPVSVFLHLSDCRHRGCCPVSF